MRKDKFINLIIFFRKFIDQIEYGHSISPYLYLGSGDKKYLWEYDWIIGDFLNYTYAKGVVKPVRYILKKDNYLIIQDKEFNFEDEIEIRYRMHDLEDDEDYRPRGWTDPKFLELFRKKYPKAFVLYDKKIRLKKELEKRYGIKINEVIRDTGISFLEIRYNIQDLSQNEILDRIFEAERIFVELYSKLFDNSLEDFKVDWSDYKEARIALYNLLGLLNEIIKIISEEDIIKVMELKNHEFPEKKVLRMIIYTPTQIKFITQINYNQRKHEYKTYYEVSPVKSKIIRPLKEVISIFKEYPEENTLRAEVLSKRKVDLIKQFEEISKILHF